MSLVETIAVVLLPVLVIAGAARLNAWYERTRRCYAEGCRNLTGGRLYCRRCIGGGKGDPSQSDFAS